MFSLVANECQCKVIRPNEGKRKSSGLLGKPALKFLFYHFFGRLRLSCLLTIEFSLPLYHFILKYYRGGTAKLSYLLT